jgi:hypothetical protein
MTGAELAPETLCFYNLWRWTKSKNVVLSSIWSIDYDRVNYVSELQPPTGLIIHPRGDVSMLSHGDDDAGWG